MRKQARRLWEADHWPALRGQRPKACAQWSGRAPIPFRHRTVSLRRPPLSETNERGNGGAILEVGDMRDVCRELAE